MDQLYEHSLVQLFNLIEDALCLDAPMALKQIQRAIASRLNGKRALEIRALLGEGSDFGSAEEHAATLAESAFVPESFEEPRQPASSIEPPALLKQPSFSGVLATTDAQEAALGLVDVATLVELKGMNRRWRALARRVLCSRLCRRDGQPVPTQLDEITDLDVEKLIEAGRPWEVYIAGRMLPGLARIHGYGFEVDVAKIRAAEVADQMFAAVRDHQRITEAPLRLRAAEGYPEYGCHPAYHQGARSIVEAIRVNSSLTSLDLTCNRIGSEGASALGEALKVNRSLLRVDVRGNIIAGDGAAQLSAAVLGNLKIEMFNDIPIKEMRADSFTELNINGKGIGDEGIMTGLHPSGTYIVKGIAAIADALRINGSLTKLSLASNMLGEDGTKSLCEALQDSKTLKELDLSGSFPAYNNIGYAAVAEAAKN
ncbi:nod3 protein [Chrysochromulina tobinii]|uniref:Nod3 protein n=1 Tax=Chrysochromulina tobinii TaxID=1460289 RepID=A0A0M0J2Z2_9EUKA|nr:nod3 protein [Chrysochromulina tobinii]|eukprot:KOO20924.1 nod3 protein [Chrysochromulina sp. CCMP291]